MFNRLKITNTFSLQVFQILRFLSFTLVGIYFTKSHVKISEIGDWELMMTITSGLSYFWIQGVIQSLLPMYNNNTTFEFSPRPALIRSPELYNAFILLLFFSGLFTIMIISFGSVSLPNKTIGSIPYHNLLAAYFFFNNPCALIEYIYLLKNKPKRILAYGLISFFVLLLMVCIPIVLGWGILASIWALLIYTVLRFTFLVIIIIRYSKPEFSWRFIKSHLKLGYPLMLSALLTGSTQYTDQFLATLTVGSKKFAVFKYGAMELPLVSQLTNSLSHSMLIGFADAEKMRYTLRTIKVKSLQLMHYLFPLTIIFMIFGRYLYTQIIFTPEFNRSADIFMVYLLIVSSRLVFPQTLLMGLQKNKVLFRVSVVCFVLNIALSLLFIRSYGMVGLALGTVVVLALEKIFLIFYNYSKLKIAPQDYIPMRWFVFYSSILVLVFVLIDHGFLRVY